MTDWLFPSFVAVIILLIICGVIRDRVEARNLRHRSIVERKEYPNNHHVLGVGYYHAADQRWHVAPWNEFRENLGYYWDGTWHEAPDVRHISSSVPDAEEILRVNEAWRRAGPEAAASFWADVDRNGFGTAIGRRQGS